MDYFCVLPPWLLIDPLLHRFLSEDIGRGDRTTQPLLRSCKILIEAEWIAKAPGVIAGLPIASRVFKLLNEEVTFATNFSEGEFCNSGQRVAQISGPLDALFMGERVALNLVMHMSGVASLTRQYTKEVADLPVIFTDTRKTTPGLRILEKYATQVGGAVNHRMGLDDAVMIKDNHIAVAGGIGEAVTQIRSHIPYPLTVELETGSLKQVQEALEHGVDIIMLDNMPLTMMEEAVQIIRKYNDRIKIEASGNITLETIRAIAKTGVDYISSSAPVTQARWLDLSMKINS